VVKPRLTSIVIDTSVIAKFFTSPPRNLQPAIYRREAETRRKIDLIMKITEACDFIVYYPRSGIVELASVLKRAGFNREEILKIVNTIYEDFAVVDEKVIYPKALDIAIERAPSGFDTYFLALSHITSSILITDDKGMASHGKNIGIPVLFVREATPNEIKETLKCY